jgi:hypothetical protein
MLSLQRNGGTDWVQLYECGDGGDARRRGGEVSSAWGWKGRGQRYGIRGVRGVGWVGIRVGDDVDG